MSVHKQTAARLHEENVMLRDRAAKLEGQTDLQPLITIIREWVTEGRGRFDSAERALSGNTAALTELINEVKAQRATSEDSYRQLTAAFMAHTLEDKEQQLEATRTRLRVANALDELERRLSTVAVQVGVTKWEPLKAGD